MAIYMPPLCRKKRVLDRYDPDTFRVISKHAEDTHPKHEFEDVNKPSEWRRQWLENEGLALPDIYNRKTEVLPHTAPDFRANKPHPGSCGFLRHNVRLLNEPICSVYTQVPADGNQHWWPSGVPKEPLEQPPRTNDTIYRVDFMEKQEKPTPFGATRHTSNPNKEPALGTVPVNFLRPKDGSQRLFKEKFSYEHMYNSRLDPNYPIRGKRHGAFVWDKMPADTTQKFVNHYRVISAEEGARRQAVLESERLANEAAKLLDNTTYQQSYKGDGTGTGHIVNTFNEQTNDTDQQVVCEEKKKSKKSSPANSGNASPKHSAGKKGSKPSSLKKVPSRKGSVSNGAEVTNGDNVGSNGENAVQKCTTEVKDDCENVTTT